MNNGKHGLRGKVGGWTASTSRRNMRFLWSVDTDDLTGQGGRSPSLSVIALLPPRNGRTGAGSIGSGFSTPVLSGCTG